MRVSARLHCDFAPQLHPHGHLFRLNCLLLLRLSWPPPYEHFFSDALAFFCLGPVNGWQGMRFPPAASAPHAYLSGYTLTHTYTHTHTHTHIHTHTHTSYIA